MKIDRMLHGFNAALYCVNGVLWATVAHIMPLAIISVAIAVGEAVLLRMSRED